MYKKDNSPGNLFDPKKGQKSKKKKKDKDKHPRPMSKEKSATPDVGYVKVFTVIVNSAICNICV